MKRSLPFVIAGFLASLFVLLPASFSEAPPKDSEFVYARIRYHLNPDGYRVAEVPWHHDYPYSDEVFPQILSESQSSNQPDVLQLVDIDSPVFKYPFAYTEAVTWN
jgi:hypothetical protein